jgi:TonB-dependent Receptor Plug Domain/Carboxypeptidase regulatory-like domain/Gram-negative bacterial TonB protein C-terminal
LRSRQRSALQFGCLCGRMLGGLVIPVLLSAQGAEGAIGGTIRDTSGTAVGDAEITLDSPGWRAVTDGSGEFRLSRVPAGKLELRVRRLGFLPESTAVLVEPERETPVNVRLTPVAFRLPTVEVLRKSEPYDSRLAGFNARKERQVGHIVTREQLDRMSSARLVDALREVPGVQLRSLRGGGTTLVLRGSHCAPLVFIDGFPADAGTMDLDMIDLASVEGIEVYSGAATVPSEFMGARETQGCGVIAIWSRPTRPKKQRIGQVGKIDLEKLLASGAVYTSDQVDDPALLTKGSVVPVYPDSLWGSGIGGRVVAEFIVDPQGLIEPGSLRIVSATHPYFVSSVRAALGGAVFRAALLGGKAVRQIVQLPFLFSPRARDSIPSPGN